MICENYCEPIYTCSVAKSCLTLWSHGLQQARLPCPSLSARVCSNSCPLSWGCHPTISFSVTPFSSCPQYFPAPGSFPVSQLFALGGPSIRASASVPPMSIQNWFPLGLTGLISLLSKTISRVFSSTRIQNHQFFCTQLSLWFRSSVHDYWKNHSFDYMDLCGQSDVSAFKYAV